MEEGRPSSTAQVAAMWRAAHLLWDDDPKIFQDPLALGLSGMESEAALRAALDTLQATLAQRLSPEHAQALFHSMRAGTIVRSRYTEDELSEALERRAMQYVILGAGLDSFAYRRGDLADMVRVFEVDHPATQHWKQARLRALNIEPPPNLTFIACDFARQRWGEALRTGGYRPEDPAFFSWLGVTWYLSEEAIFETLQQIARMAPGSEVVFDYPISEALLDHASREMMAPLKADMAARGEPWLSSFDPTSLTEQVRGLGFAHVRDLSPEEANARYFAGRTDGLRVRRGVHLMKAQVGSVS
jgi:methyltransferase (TIGR00027 family)